MEQPLKTLVTFSVTHLHNLLKNEFFRGGLGLLLFGAAASITSKIVNLAWDRFKHLFIITVEVNSKDEGYQWLVEWLAQHEYSKRTHRLSLSRFFKDILTKATVYTQSGDNSSKTTRPKALERLIEEAREVSYAKEEGRVVLWTSRGGNWVKFGTPRRPRPLDSILLPPGVTESVSQEIESFFSSEEWYRKRGLPYRKGYLFCGPPGTGKSSFIAALAGEFKMNLCLVSLSSKDLSDESLLTLLNSTPPRSALVLEDLDHAFHARQASGGHHVTFSGLLNALDGVAAQEGSVVFLTTNHPQLLDPALLRPGRVDRRVDFELASFTQTHQLFLHFFAPLACAAEATQFAQLIPEKSLSMAELQNLLQEGRTPQGAIALATLKHRS